MTLNIFGVGTDIVKNSRIKKLIKNKKFINRIFTSSEIKDSKKINQKVFGELKFISFICKKKNKKMVVYTQNIWWWNINSQHM